MNVEGEGKGVPWDSSVSDGQMVPPAKSGRTWRKTGLLFGEGVGRKPRKRVRGIK